MTTQTTEYSIQQASTALGIPPRTLRHLCNAGLVPHVRRNRLGHRILEEWQVDHLRILLGLRQAGLTKPELKRYARLVRQGCRTLPERKALFETRKRQLWLELENIQKGIDFLERQVEIIDQKTHS